MTLYIAAILGVLTVEMIHYSQNQSRYTNFSEYWMKRWDNLAVAFLSAVLLCYVYPDLSRYVHENLGYNLTELPKLAGLVIGLASTPIIYAIKKFVTKKVKNDEA
jgi:hypothetical protein